MIPDCGLDSTGLGWGYVAGSCEHCDERWISRKGEKFLDLLSVSREVLCSVELIRHLL